MKTMKSNPAIIEIGKPNFKMQLIRKQLFSSVRIFLADASIKAAKAIKLNAKKLQKATNVEEVADAGFDAIEWDNLVNDVQKELKAATHEAAMEGASQLNLNNNVDTLDLVESIAMIYAAFRAAEMVGKKWLGSDLVVNPKAKFNIANTTKDDLRDMVIRATENKVPLDKLEEQIREASIFSKSRAELIAKTEIAMAQVKGHLDIWKSSGLIKKVNIVLSELHNVTDLCDNLVAKNPYFINEAPDIPAHVNCRCIIVQAEEA